MNRRQGRGATRDPGTLRSNGMRTKKIIHFGVAVIILALGAAGLAGLTANRPKIEKRRAETPAPLVRSMAVKTGPYTVIIPAEGTVRPLREINIVPQVSGKVIEISPSLVNGGDFKKDDVLLRLDPVDYHLSVTLARAQVKDAESRLAMTREEAAMAKEEWRLHQSGSRKGGQSKPPPPLVAKTPQLAAAWALLAANRANLEGAQLRLSRTEIKAPFDGRVGGKMVDVGQYVAPGQALASIFSTEGAEIVAPLENEDLFWFHVPGFTPGHGPGANVTVHTRFAGYERTWRGRVARAEGKLDERTRMVNVVIRVDDPYAGQPPLSVGLYVVMTIHGRTVPGAAVIPRAGMRADGTVWVVDDENILHFRKVTVARIQGDTVLVSEGLRDGDRVVVSSLRSVSDGMRVRQTLVRKVEAPS